MASASLPGMPTELLQEIQSSLTYASRQALRLTCRALYFKVNNLGSNASYDIWDPLEIEQWPQYNHAAQRPQYLKQPIAGKDYFAYARCLRIRSAISFTNAMTKGKRGKAGSVYGRCDRTCIQCGIARGVYRKSSYLRFGGANVGVGTVCRYCGDFHSAHSICS